MGFFASGNWHSTCEPTGADATDGLGRGWDGIGGGALAGLSPPTITLKNLSYLTRYRYSSIHIPKRYCMYMLCNVPYIDLRLYCAKCLEKRHPPFLFFYLSSHVT